MLRDRSQLQSGQAMTELVVAVAAVVLPLALGVIYIAKYQDLKYSAIQASRYAAFERVFDPWAAHKSDAVLAEETRARFFMDPMQSNKGAVGFQDSTQGAKKPQSSLNTNWLGTGGDPIVTQYSGNGGIGVDVRKGSVSDTPYSALQTLADTVNFKIPDPGIAQAHVTVPLAPIRLLNNRSLTLDESTAVLTDGYNANGAGKDKPDQPAANSVRSRVFNDWGIVLGKIPGVQSVLSALDSGIATWGWQGLSDTDGPQWGCVNPDVVPGDAAPGASYDPTKSKTSC